MGNNQSKQMGHEEIAEEEEKYTVIYGVRVPKRVTFAVQEEEAHECTIADFVEMYAFLKNCAPIYWQGPYVSLNCPVLEFQEPAQERPWKNTLNMHMMEVTMGFYHVSICMCPASSNGGAQTASCNCFIFFIIKEVQAASCKGGTCEHLLCRRHLGP